MIVITIIILEDCFNFTDQIIESEGFDCLTQVY